MVDVLRITEKGTLAESHPILPVMVRYPFDPFRAVRKVEPFTMTGK
jgi:hypothetical protein